MKKYYNINVNLSENLETVSFALHTDESFGKYLLAATRYKNEISPYDSSVNSLRVAIYYHMAEYFIDQHTAQLAQNVNTSTLLTNILSVLEDTKLPYYDDEEDCAAYLIDQGMIANDPSLIRKGLFRAFVHYFEDMTIHVEPKAHTKSTATSILEFDPKNCVEQFKKYGEKECYSVQITINGCDGDLIEEFYDHTIYTHPYLGEMMLSDSDYDTLDQASGFYGGLIDAMKWKAAVKLLEEHKSLKSMCSDQDDDEPTPLENFWAMALEEGEIDEDEYEEIMDDITNKFHIETIYEIMDNYELVILEEFYRGSITDEDSTYTTDYED